jgi:hypothetical protein
MLARAPKRIAGAFAAVAAGLSLLAIAAARAESPSSREQAKVAADMARAAQDFLAALSPEQKAKAAFEFKDAERFNWHFIPRERKGLPLKEMNPEQRKRAQALLETGLSRAGVEKALVIMSLEQILREIEGRPIRDPELYYVSLFGAPEARKTWGWRIEGHHLSLNFTIVEGRTIAAAPSFFGANPAEVKSGPRQGLRALAVEEDLARRLARSLTPEQRALGLVAAEAPKDILLVPKEKVRLLEPAGIPLPKLEPAQAKLLKDLVRGYAERLRSELSERDLSRIEQAGWDRVHFAWAGGLEPGQGHYYRVQGPTFVLEYDNTQNNANHIHTVWHDLTENFGGDPLREHYEKEHK